MNISRVVRKVSLTLPKPYVVRVGTWVMGCPGKDGYHGYPLLLGNIWSLATAAFLLNWTSFSSIHSDIFVNWHFREGMGALPTLTFPECTCGVAKDTVLHSNRCY